MDKVDFDFLEKIVGKEFISLRDEIAEDLAHDELGTVFSYPDVHVVVSDKYQIIYPITVSKNELKISNGN